LKKQREEIRRKKKGRKEKGRLSGFTCGFQGFDVTSRTRALFMLQQGAAMAAQATVS
jgi:hypothetical protein